MKRLIVSYIVENEIDWLPLSLEPIINDIDGVVIVDGGSKDGTIEYIKNMQEKYPDKITLIQNRYEHEYIGANGRQRNVYLKYLQLRYEDQWNITLDADEVTNDIDKFRFLIEGFEKEPLQDDIMCSVKMRHLIQDVQHEDNWYVNNLPNHFVPNRFFKISSDMYYPEVEHPVLSSKNADALYLATNLPTIWHFGYIRHITQLRKKYLNHLAKSNMHTKQFLQEWYMKHLIGEYPRGIINISDLPDSIKRDFEIDPDEVYFKDRIKIELKHIIDVRMWWDYFKPKTTLEAACGAGQRVWAMLGHSVDAYGFDSSKWIVDKAPLFASGLTGRIFQHNILQPKEEWLEKYELVIAYDIMEHLDEKQIRIALTNLYDWSSKYVLLSICFEGDPNFVLDKTHITCKPKAWWEEQIKMVGFEIMPTPNHFPFGHQIVLGRKNAN